MIHTLGRINRYIPERNFGWITQEDGSTIFFHSDNVWNLPPEEIEIGQDVMFVPALSQKGGRPFAREVQIVSPELIEAIGTATRLYGHIGSSAERGFGYISPTYSKASLWFHRNSVPSGEELETGQYVSFRVQEDEKSLIAFDVAPEEYTETVEELEPSTEVSATA
jgi:cold shock CspA family protein